MINEHPWRPANLRHGPLKGTRELIAERATELGGGFLPAHAIR